MEEEEEDAGRGGGREYRVELIVMAGRPGARVWVPMMKAEAALAV